MSPRYGETGGHLMACVQTKSGEVLYLTTKGHWLKLAWLLTNPPALYVGGIPDKHLRRISKRLGGECRTFAEPWPAMPTLRARGLV